MQGSHNQDTCREADGQAARRLQGEGSGEDRLLESEPVEEWLEVVDPDDGRVVGVARRRECHGNPALVHRTAHVLVFSSGGAILLQKRAAHKEIQPGKWDSTVGGHLGVGESYLEAACREMSEEIGVDSPDISLEHLFDTRICNAIESERVRVYRAVWDGPFSPQAEEVESLRFWSLEEIRAALGSGVFTPSLEMELGRLLAAEDTGHACCAKAGKGRDLQDGGPP